MSEEQNTYLHDLFVEEVQPALMKWTKLGDTFYESGKKAQYDEFWDDFQRNGTRTEYRNAFRAWSSRIFKPKYDIKPTGEANEIFRSFFTEETSRDLVEILKECNVELDLSKATTLQLAFQDSQFSHLGVIDATSVPSSQSYGLQNVFYNANRMNTIDKFIVAETCPLFRATFEYCSVKNITFEGTIAKNGLSFANTSNITHDSLMSAINCLKDYSEDTSGTAWKITLGSTNKAKLTAEEIAIATNKGWEVA